MKRPSLRSLVIHPVLFALYPAVNLLSQNLGEVTPYEAYRALIALAAAGLGLSLLLALVLRNAGKGGAIATLLFILFFTHGWYSGHPAQATVVYVASVLVIGCIIWSRKDWRPVTFFLNVTALIAVALPALVTGAKLAQHGFGTSGDKALAFQGRPPLVMTDAMKAKVGNTPNIYYIIVDGYARADVLAEFYDYDNAPFIDFLRDQDFFVADQARSNYGRTEFSLASSLNFYLLDPFIEHFNLEESTDLHLLMLSITYSRVNHVLRHFGYTIYAHGTGFQRDNVFGADHVIQPEAVFNQFESILLKNTPFFWFTGLLDFRNGYDLHRETLLLALEEVEKAPELPSPKLVFVHLICPHPPFVFAEDGSPVYPTDPSFTTYDGDFLDMSVEEYRQGYRDQLHYLNTELKDMVVKIRQDDPEAIIILQSDHGPGSTMAWNNPMATNMKERMSILNAIYFPDHRGALYDSLSPVNTFAIIFNTFFGTEFELASDTSYAATTAQPFAFAELLFD